MSKEFDTEYQLAQQDFKNSHALQEISTQWSNNAHERLFKLKQQIIEGKETTGNLLSDVLLVRHGFNAEKYEERYRELQESLKGKNGEMVLRVEHNLVNFPHLSNMRDSDSNTKMIKTSFGVGLLTNESLVYSISGGRNKRLGTFGGSFASCIEFPTDGFYAKITEYPFDRDKNGYLHERLSADATDTDTKLERAAWNMPFSPKPEFKTELIIGNDSVKEWFAARKGSGTLDSVIAELNSRQLV